MTQEILSPTSTEFIASGFLFVAMIHTFSAQFFEEKSQSLPIHSWGHLVFHLLGEIEFIFPLWAIIFTFIILVTEGSSAFFQVIRSVHLHEPIFIFVIMAIASARPVVEFASLTMEKIASVLPIHKNLRNKVGYYWVALTVGPILGSLITEPAAMTVTALILRERLFSQPISRQLRYLSLGVLFVNISIGGVLSPFAAPPVLVVAKSWGWDLQYMLQHFGWKAVVVILINTSIVATLFGRELCSLEDVKQTQQVVWENLQGVHLLFLGAVVWNSERISTCLVIFILFLLFHLMRRLPAVISPKAELFPLLQLSTGLKVGIFLLGLTTLGSYQSWWLQPVITYLSPGALFLSVVSLTALVDNAALTYLGSQISGLSHELRYLLVAGAVAGGGLTVIANAPNPAGFSILKESFGEEGMSPLLLFLGALVPTLIATSFFWMCPL